MEQIQIGDPVNSCSSICIGSHDSDIYKNAHISENNKEFWYHSDLANVDLRINKSSPEGKKIEKIIAKGKAKPLSNYIDGLVASVMTASDIKTVIKWQQEEYFDRGLRSARLSILKALGL